MKIPLTLTGLILALNLLAQNTIVNITVTNANPNKAITQNCQLGEEYKLVKVEIVTGREITDYNDFGKEEKVFTSDFKPGKTNNEELQIEVPAHSVILVQLEPAE